jgi:hypothetical protein
VVCASVRACGVCRLWVSPRSNRTRERARASGLAMAHGAGARHGARRRRDDDVRMSLSMCAAAGWVQRPSFLLLDVQLQVEHEGFEGLYTYAVRTVCRCKVNERYPARSTRAG